VERFFCAESREYHGRACAPDVMSGWKGGVERWVRTDVETVAQRYFLLCLF